MLRGIFKSEEDPAYWKKAVTGFSNGIPKFDTKEEAMHFTQRVCQNGSNPGDRNLMHSISTLISWDQIEAILLPKIVEYSKDRSPTCVTVPMDENRFIQEMEASGCREYAKSRLNLSIHNCMNSVSTINTLKYLFFHMRCGIFVMIRKNELVIFCPFVNKDYHNTWREYPEVESADGSLAAYYQEKEKHYRSENVIPKDMWWANGNIICNEHDKTDNGVTQWWGDHFLLQLKDMLAETCSQREVPDCEFFVNKRDYPQLKYNELFHQVVEPYGFIFNKDDRDPRQDLPLSDHAYKTYAPILSFYSSERFADIPFPPSEDWEAATGQVFPSTFFHSIKDGALQVATPRDLFTAANLRKFECLWEDKVNTAFFRGTATGGGVTAQTNQRLRLAQLSYDWSKLSEQDCNSNDVAVPYLDAKITGWNMRDKKIASRKMTFLRKSDFPFPGDRKTNFVEIYKQSTYKYLVYVEGHCAACRYGFMMMLGSVILKVESECVADQMWYFPLLQPYVDHVPVKADLSDLKEKIDWCRSNDQKCREIAANARQLHERFISKEGILDYMQMLFVEIASHWHNPPEWASGCPIAANPPFSTKHLGDYCVDGAFCSICSRRRALAAEAAANKAPVAESKEDELKRKRNEKKQKQIELERQKRKLQEAENKALEEAFKRKRVA